MSFTHFPPELREGDPPLNLDLQALHPLALFLPLCLSKLSSRGRNFGDCYSFSSLPARVPPQAATLSFLISPASA